MKTPKAVMLQIAMFSLIGPWEQDIAGHFPHHSEALVYHVVKKQKIPPVAVRKERVDSRKGGM